MKKTTGMNATIGLITVKGNGSQVFDAFKTSDFFSNVTRFGKTVSFDMNEEPDFESIKTLADAVVNSVYDTLKQGVQKENLEIAFISNRNSASTPVSSMDEAIEAIYNDILEYYSPEFKAAKVVL